MGKHFTAANIYDSLVPFYVQAASHCVTSHCAAFHFRLRQGGCNYVLVSHELQEEMTIEQEIITLRAVEQEIKKKKKKAKIC